MGSTTTVTSPGYPDGYHPDLFCIWTLVTEEHNRIVLTLNTLDIEAGTCQYDSVRLFDGRERLPIPNQSKLFSQLNEFNCLFVCLNAGDGYSPLGVFCRRDHQGQVVTASANAMQVVFSTDSTVNRTGFLFTASTGTHLRR